MMATYKKLHQMFLKQKDYQRVQALWFFFLTMCSSVSALNSKSSRSLRFLFSAMGCKEQRTKGSTTVLRSDCGYNDSSSSTVFAVFEMILERV
jgi:hypothetical protein